MPSISSVSQWSNACWAAGLPIRPLLSDLVGVVVLQALLGLEGQHHRGGQSVGQRQHLVAGMAGPGAHQQRDGFGAVQQRGRLLQGGLVGHDRSPFGDEVGSIAGGIEPGDVTGQSEHRHSGGAERQVHGLLEQPGQLVGAGHGPAEGRHVGEHGVVVDLLEEVGAQLGERHLPADGQHGSMRFPGVVEPVEQVQRARSDGAHADSERAGQLGLGAGGERARLLVTHADPLHALLAADRVGHRVQGVADHAPDVPDAQVGERGDDRLGDGRHQRLAALARGAKLSGSARSQSPIHSSGGSSSS